MSAQAGILYRDARPVPDSVLDTLTMFNCRRGPDRSGVYAADGIAMLSFLRHFDHLSTQELQPVRTAAGSVVTWDGRLDARDDFLVRLQPELAGDFTDARLMALALDKWPTDEVLETIGDWSLASWNSLTRTLLLARDFLGTCDLYYCVRPDFFAWSTAIEPLATLCDEVGHINERYLVRSIAGLSLDDETPYQDIRRLPAGHALRVRPGEAPAVRNATTFDAPTVRYASGREYQEHYRALLIDAVRLRLRSQTTVWSEVSGGFDSSTVTCIAQSLIHGSAVEAPSLRPITMTVPDDPEADERYYAGQVAHFCSRPLAEMSFAQFFALEPRGTLLLHLHESLTNEPFPEPAVPSDCRVLLSGRMGDGLTKPFSLNDLLAEHLREGRLRAFVRDGVQFCRYERRWLPHIWTEFFRGRSRRAAAHDRTKQFKGLAEARRASPDNLAMVLALKPQLLRHLAEHSSGEAGTRKRPPKAGVRNFFVDMILPGREANAFCADTAIPTLRRAFPFLHRPLISFVAGVPPSAMWGLDNHRAFVCAAFRDALPAAILDRRVKGEGATLLRRFHVAMSMEILSNVTALRLVAHDIADAEVLRDLLSAYVAGAQPSESIVARLLQAEALVRMVNTRVSDVSHSSTIG